MSEANTATYDASVPNAAIAAHPAPRLAIHRIQSPVIGPSGNSARTLFERQVREEPPFYIPDLLSGKAADTDPELYNAADEHARHLHRAQRGIEDALNLACVLSASFEGDGDSRAVQAEAVLTVIDRKLNKALDRLDRHDTRHRNLFFAYFEPEEQAQVDEPDED